MGLRHMFRCYAPRLRGVIHVGGHLGQEAATYLRLGAANQLWIEPQPANFQAMSAALPKRSGIRAVHAACGERESTAMMRLFAHNRGASDSLLPLTEAFVAANPAYANVQEVPVRVAPLDTLVRESGANADDFDAIVADVQGYELHVLRGAPGLLAGPINCVVIEVWRTCAYAGGCTVGEIDRFLEPFGFRRVHTLWQTDTWGDAAYVKPASGSALTKVYRLLRSPRGERQLAPGANSAKPVSDPA
jgi:FkbM family methyltransferase